MAAKRRSRSKERLPYQNASLSVEERVRDLLGRMTLDEKVRQLTQRNIAQLMHNGRVAATRLRETFGRLGIGTLQDPRIDPRGSAEAVNAVQRYLVEKTQLGIPAMVISECLHGHLSGGATVFPQAIALGSTWNPALIERMAAAAAREARAVGVAQALSPDLDLCREPRWGRVEETYGEDPYLVGRMGVAYVRGIQGDGPRVDRDHLVATVKHFAAHGSPEAGINLAPVAGSLRDLYTTYLPPFRDAVVEAGALSVMPAYSEFDGTPAHASKLLLTRVLREQWNFQGYVYSDYGGVAMLHRLHKTAHTAAEAGRQVLAAGMDLEAPGEYGYGDNLIAMVQSGEAPIEWVDRSVARVLRVKFLAGLFEQPYVDAAKAPAVVHNKEHRALALELARESIILLKNERKLLPLDPNVGSVAVIGPNAAIPQLGDYCMLKETDVTPLLGIQRAVSKRTRVLHAEGCGLYGSSRDGFAAAVEAAKQADVAVVCIGGTSTSRGGVGWGSQKAACTCGEGFDRTDLTPPGVQEELVRAIHATGTPTVVVLVHGRPYSIPWIAEHCPAIIEAWYPGEEGGTALGEILFGKVNPSGRLPITAPRSVGHVPAFYNHKPSARGYYHKSGTPEAPGRDYVFSSPAPLWPFGHGLSYTTFRYSNLRVTPKRIPPAGRVEVSIDVRNAGARAGKEVVQLYLNDLVSSVTTPVKALRRFEKIHLRAGEKKTVRFTLGSADLQLLDEDMNWVVEPGEFEVTVGGRQARFTVAG